MTADADTRTAPDASPDGGSDSGRVEHRRATVRPDKADAVAELAEAFRSSSAAVLTEYRGLSVKQITALRVALGDDTSYAVVKNTLTRLAARDAGLQGLDELLAGPTAVAFISGDPVVAAKGLRDFGRTNPALVVKGGVLDGRPLSADEVRRLADLESREVLLGRVAGGLLATLSRAVYLLNAPLAQVARLAGALQAKAEEDPSVIGGAGAAPSASAGATAGDGDGGDADSVAADVAERGAPDSGPVPGADDGTAVPAGGGAESGDGAGDGDGGSTDSVAADVAQLGAPDTGPVPGAGDGASAAS